MIKDLKDESRQEKKSENGFDQDRVTGDTISKTGKSFYAGKAMENINIEELKGFGFLATGFFLYIYAMGWFPLFNWVIMATGIFFIIYGVNRAKVWDKTLKAYHYLRSLFTKNEND